MTATDLVGEVIDYLLERRRPHCRELGIAEPCGLSLGHEGFHKGNHTIWPNAAESVETWATIGRHLMTVGPLPHLSLKEMEYALDAAQRLDSVDHISRPGSGEVPS